MNFIDLFAGAGGMSEGFIRAGFKPIAHVEMDKAACFTLKTRVCFHYHKTEGELATYIKYLKGKISRQDLYKSIPQSFLNSVLNYPIGPEFNKNIFQEIDKQAEGKEIDLIIGGPPCQAYSLAGRARSKNGMEGDPRNYLYKEYAKYLEKYSPKLFVFENVLGLLSAKGGQYLRDMEALFNKKGYEMRLYKVEANNFNVLQKRKRIIIIGKRVDFPFNFPDLESVRMERDFLVKDLFLDLPVLKAGEGDNKDGKYQPGRIGEYLKTFEIRNGIKVLSQHCSRPHTDQDKKIYKIAVEKWNKDGLRLCYNDLPEQLKTHRNRSSFFDRFKVVADDLPYSQTIVAHISKDGHYYIHPDIEQNRSISIREAARLQSFPDDFYFEGVKEKFNRTAAFKQIGNAVPPLLAKRIAFEIKRNT